MTKTLTKQIVESNFEVDDIKQYIYDKCFVDVGDIAFRLELQDNFDYIRRLSTNISIRIEDATDL